MKKVVHVVAGLALVSCLTPVAAHTTEARTIKVFHDDLNLRTDTGVNSLDNRIRRAIIQVCGGTPRGDRMEALGSRRCQAETLANITPSRDTVIRFARNGGAIKVAQIEVKAAIPK